MAAHHVGQDAPPAGLLPDEDAADGTGDERGQEDLAHHHVAGDDAAGAAVLDVEGADTVHGVRLDAGVLGMLVDLTAKLVLPAKAVDTIVLRRIKVRSPSLSKAGTP
jgi:hypothetical protein